MPAANSFVLILFLVMIIFFARRVIKLLNALILWFETKTAALKRYRPPPY